MSDDRYIYDLSEGDATMRHLLGGKGAGVAEMNRVGVPVPDAFTVTTTACVQTMKRRGEWPEGLADQVAEGLKRLEERTGRTLGGTEKPLLVSVRSGAVHSMPGMMDTILNLGISDESVEAVAAESGNERFAWDCYRRFIQMYGEVVEGVPQHLYEDALSELKHARGVAQDTDLSAEDLKQLVGTFKEISNEHLGGEWTSDPVEQLNRAIDAVFKSWLNPRAEVYRRANNIPADLGTAVNIMQMVFGNRGDTSATGVCFTRNPSTGEKALYGEFLVNAQGEDVVAGIRTPRPLEEMKEVLPEAYDELIATMHKMEQHYRDMQDMEFTIERGKLWMLQTRSGKRTAKAALKIAVDMVAEGLITKEEAVARIDPAQLDQLLHPTLDAKAEKTVIGRGLPASPGAATGRIVFSAEDAEIWVDKGEKVILCRTETSPEDITGMHVSEGILTTRGGMTSHAAVVARGMGTPCVSGAGELRVDYSKKTLHALGKTLNEGDVITLDGSTGEIMLGEVAMIQPEVTGDFGELMAWVDEIKVIGVRANAETPLDALTAKKFGAEGIGLSRTEHMFFDPHRIVHMRQMILARDETERRKALDKLLPHQRQDFLELFHIMDGLPITIRLLDPPLNEFLPHTDEEMDEVAKAAGVTTEDVRVRRAELDESNPMLGHRGCRLAIAYPEICEMQARAIFEAQAEIMKEGKKAYPEVMVPLVSIKKEFEMQKAIIDRIAKEVMAEQGIELEYAVGTMIELPRACLIADQIAEQAEFFSFGTNDLTQTAYGFSRDDAGTFLDIYHRQGVLEQDPFVSIDQEGVGELVQIGVERGRKTRPDIKLGICGEHGGDPASVAFCHRIGLTYVSCSPYRVPIARLAAAQAALADK